MTSMVGESDDRADLSRSARHPPAHDCEVVTAAEFSAVRRTLSRRIGDLRPRRGAAILVGSAQVSQRLAHRGGIRRDRRRTLLAAGSRRGRTSAAVRRRARADPGRQQPRIANRHRLALTSWRAPRGAGHQVYSEAPGRSGVHKSAKLTSPCDVPPINVSLYSGTLIGGKTAHGDHN